MSSFWRLENILSPSFAACESSFLICALILCMIFKSIWVVGVVGSVCRSVHWWVRVRWGLVPFLHKVVSMVSKSVGSVMLLCFVSVLSALS